MAATSVCGENVLMVKMRQGKGLEKNLKKWKRKKK